MKTKQMDIYQTVRLDEDLERRQKAQQTVNDRAKQNKNFIHSKNNTPLPPRSRRSTRFGRTRAKRPGDE